MIFVDSSFLIGFFVKTDYWHDRVIKILPELDQDKIISYSVLSEVITLIGQKTDATNTKLAYNFFKDNYHIFNESKIDNIIDKIMKTYLEHNTNLSFTDSSIVEVMKELKIKKIASFDKDFDKIKEIKRIH